MTEKKQTAIAKPQTALEIQARFYAETMEIWKDEKSIHEMFAKDLSNVEFKYFVSLGLLFGANPFAGEIWAVKYDKNKPASIFLGRNFKRRKAQELEEYDGHYSAAVYSKDKFKVVNGVPDHEYANGDRGVLERAYCLVYRKGITRPFYKEVKFNEYDKGFSTWKGMPETMIVKVAENQCLTMAFQGTFQGTYDESEEWKEKDPENVELNGEMEVSAEKVRDHDKTGFEKDGEPPKNDPEPEPDPTPKQETEASERATFVTKIKDKIAVIVGMSAPDDAPPEEIRDKSIEILEEFSTWNDTCAKSTKELEQFSVKRLQTIYGKLKKEIEERRAKIEAIE